LFQGSEPSKQPNYYSLDRWVNIIDTLLARTSAQMGHNDEANEASAQLLG
jgi:hypothetical protein